MQDYLYVVEKGDTLFTISKKFYGDGNYYLKIARDNNISNPNLINVGQMLDIYGEYRYPANDPNTVLASGFPLFNPPTTTSIVSPKPSTPAPTPLVPYGPPAPIAPIPSVTKRYLGFTMNQWLIGSAAVVGIGVLLAMASSPRSSRKTVEA